MDFIYEESNLYLYLKVSPLFKKKCFFKITKKVSCFKKQAIYIKTVETPRDF